MANNINIVDGKAAFMSLRQSAWHNMGQVIEMPVGSAEAINLAGLNWQVNEQRLVRGDLTPVASHKAMVRSDTKETLGIVGANWTPVQNEDLFHWFDGLDGFADVTLETAGALGNGETVWILARCNGLSFDIKGDEHKAYLCLANGHGGNAQLTITPTGIRVVCQNTLRAMNEGSARKNTLASGWALKHTKSIQDTFERIRDCYARTTKGWKATQEALNLLASKPLTDEAITRLATEPFAIKPSTTEIAAVMQVEQEQGAGDERERANAAASVSAEARIQSIRQILESPTCTLTGTKDTLFAGFNAVTEYLEHHSPVRITTKNLDEKSRARAVAMKRFESANFGGGVGDERKGKAFALAMELATA